MWDSIKNYISNNISKSLFAPAAISGVTFLANMVQTLSDGHLTHSELQALISSSSLLDTGLLAIIIFILKLVKK